MQRVMVIGPCGAGKSTAAHRLADRLGLPLFHLDQLYWKPGWIDVEASDVEPQMRAILDSDRWIVDGNYGSTMEMRLQRADTVVYLDYPIALCLWRATKRVWRYRGRTRLDMAENCPERFDLQFFLYIATWNHRARPRTERVLAKSDAKILRFSHPRELARWLERLEHDT